METKDRKNEVQVAVAPQVKVATTRRVSDLEKIVVLFIEKGWEYRIAGFGKMLTAPIETEHCLFVPDYMDNSIIPPKGMEVLDGVDTVKVNLQGILIGHELAEEEPEVIETPNNSNRVETGLAIGGAAGVIGAVMLGGLLSAFALGIDPMLILVMEENNLWLEVFWWLLDE